jgi:hypothetical protein
VDFPHRLADPSVTPCCTPSDALDDMI